jgi:hypothetical protein
MHLSRESITRLRTPRPAPEAGRLECAWGVADCRGCGATIVLGEPVARIRRSGTVGLCSACAARPAAVAALAPTRLLVAGTGFSEAPVAPAVNGVREREAA